MLDNRLAVLPSEIKAAFEKEKKSKATWLEDRLATAALVAEAREKVGHGGWKIGCKPISRSSLDRHCAI